MKALDIEKTPSELYLIISKNSFYIKVTQNVGNPAATQNTKMFNKK